MYRLTFFLLLAFLLTAGDLSAQDASYFVYIQHEKNQPFYVKHDGKLLSSSAKGYVILPKLSQGKVPLIIGFPKQENAERQFVLRLAGQRDYGYLLKSEGENDYALYDLQTFATLKSGGSAAPPPAEEITVTRISNENATPEQKELMNNVQADVQAALQNQPDTTPAPKKTGFANALDRVLKDDRPDDMPAEMPKSKPPVQVVAATQDPIVNVPSEPVPSKKRNKRNSRKERALLTEEEQQLLAGVMEDEKRAAAEEALAEAAATETTGEATPPPVKKVRKSKKQEPEFINFGDEQPSTPAVTTTDEIITDRQAEKDARRDKRRAERAEAERRAFVKDSLANSEYAATTPSTVKMVNSDCAQTLETEEFRKLLRSMNSKKSDADMVDVFRKSTRRVCVSTEQVRALTQLIGTEENRYQLLDAAYPRTYDSQQFASLADLLKDEYYRGRFMAMLKK